MPYFAKTLDGPKTGDSRVTVSDAVESTFADRSPISQICNPKEVTNDIVKILQPTANEIQAATLIWFVNAAMLTLLQTELSPK